MDLWSPIKARHITACSVCLDTADLELRSSKKRPPTMHSDGLSFPTQSGWREDAALVLLRSPHCSASHSQRSGSLDLGSSSQFLPHLPHPPAPRAGEKERLPTHPLRGYFFFPEKCLLYAADRKGMTFFSMDKEKLSPSLCFFPLPVTPEHTKAPQEQHTVFS